MRLEITVPVSVSDDPTSPAAIDAANHAASQQASDWTSPVYIGRGPTAYTYATDAVPRSQAVTSDNIAPTLLPPHGA